MSSNNSDEFEQVGQSDSDDFGVKIVISVLLVTLGCVLWWFKSQSSGNVQRKPLPSSTTSSSSSSQQSSSSSKTSSSSSSNTEENMKAPEKETIESSASSTQEVRSKPVEQLPMETLQKVDENTGEQKVDENTGEQDSSSSSSSDDSPQQQKKDDTDSTIVTTTTTTSSSDAASSSTNDSQQKSFSIDYGVHGIIGRRKTMEDSDLVIEDLLEGVNATQKPSVCSLFAVFDGHGGEKASKYVAEKFHQVLMAQNDAQNDADALLKNPTQVMTQTILELEKNFLNKARDENLQDGTTAVIALVIDNQLYVANVGDSEGVLYRSDGSLIELTQVHTPAKSESESQRITNAGGKLIKGRVGHPAMNPSFFNIAVSRAIGDLMYKDPELLSGKVSGLIADPHNSQQTLRSGDILLIACDGLWDVFTFEEAYQIIQQQLKQEKTAQEISEELVQKAFHNGSLDNISACLVLFE